MHKAFKACTAVLLALVMTVSLVNGSDSDEIWGNMIHNFNNFANTALTVNQEIYKSESATNQHNRGIAWLLDSYGYFYNTPPMIVDLYTRMCSLNITASQLALMGACYANGGVNPVSKKRVVKEENVPPILAEMCMSGLYDSTGDWMYKAGLPAKSGVGGGLVAVAPGKLAMAAFSPPLDPAGNTVKGQGIRIFLFHEGRTYVRRYSASFLGISGARPGFCYPEHAGLRLWRGSDGCFGHWYRNSCPCCTGLYSRSIRFSQFPGGGAVLRRFLLDAVFGIENMAEGEECFPCRVRGYFPGFLYLP